MNILKSARQQIVITFLLGLLSPVAISAPLNLSTAPLFITQSVPPLTLLVMGKDHRLYYEAYNDATDLNGDGVLDIRYNPLIEYYGYFDSYKCYAYNNGLKHFIPMAVTLDKKCSASRWSGDFLNYVTTSRMDALRKVLYGGLRVIDSSSQTVLARAYIPQDAHSWGKEYTSIAVDGYNISDYTPYNLPSANNRHLFANTTLLNGSIDEPLLRVSLNQPYRIWEWVSIERPVAGNRVIHGGNGPTLNNITDFIVHIEVCKNNLLEPNCKPYASGKYKPTGLLQQFGENDKMKFGLLTGSYTKNLSGGVLRKNISSFTNEVKPDTGEFESNDGIVKTLNNLKVVGFGGNYMHESNCGFIFNRDFNEGECRLWGNPIAEMMYEGIRYFAGKASPTASFATDAGDDNNLSLPAPTWIDPYANNQNDFCARANMLVISDTNVSYDTDQIPGSAFSSFTGDLSPALNASSLGQFMWSQEFSSASGLHYIGQSGTNDDGTPQPKIVTSFGNIRGLAPEEPNKKGGYYSAAVAYYARINDIHNANDIQSVYTYAVALTSPLPKINIPMANGQSITLIPFGKSVGPGNSCGNINPNKGEFQPTNTIVDFYVEQLSATSGTFRINYEDAQQGADHDMDAVVKYNYQVNGDNTVTISLDSTYAAGCIIQHMGYVISGTTADGIYLEVRDMDTSAGNDVDYFLDTPPGEAPNGNWQNAAALPLTAARTFTPSTMPSATLLKNPLWYAAKWGGFIDKNGNNIPDAVAEYDEDGNGVPDNYFLVTNALKLKEQLESAFNDILDKSSSASSASLNGGTLSSDSKIYQSVFNSGTWQGQLLAFPINVSSGSIITTGGGPGGSLWDAGAILSNQNPLTGRQIISYNTTAGNGIAFRWPTSGVAGNTTELDAANVALLEVNPVTGLVDSQGQTRLNYIRGDRTYETSQGGNFRARVSVLGDIVNSAPIHIGVPNYHYPDVWATGSPENADKYSDFRLAHKNRTKMIYVGANDSMLHAFDALTGVEKLAFVPSSVIRKLPLLTSQNYSHQYFVDGTPNVGDAYFNGTWNTVLVGGLNAGGQSIYALNVTKPVDFLETNAASLVLWEFTDIDDADLGYTFSQPAIVRLANGKWAAVFGNGYNNTESDGNISATGNAVLYIVDVQTGSLIKKFDTGVGMNNDPSSTSRPNGMATPSIIDTNGDYVADIIYAGDLFGNLWKIDISDAAVSNWDFAFKSGTTPLPLYVAKDANGNQQSITTRPNVVKDKYIAGAFKVFFGTGKYMEGSDKNSTSVNTVYGIIDQGAQVASRSDLLQQTITDEVSYTAPSNKVLTYRLTSNNMLTTSHKGWYIDLVYNNQQVGERVTTNTIIRNGKLIFTTLIPTASACSFGGESWLMELDLQDGSRLAYSPFDVNEDGVFSTSDYVPPTSGPSVPPTGVKSDVGITASPVIVSSDDKEYKYMPGSSGAMQKTVENPGPNSTGRASWRQLK